ncbi:MAG: hypothetical protein JXI43_10860 [Tissierellales bacterium]|nr:hypothetical protein [Tissierellales bacterium]
MGMSLIKRFKHLNIWNKLGVIGSIASIIGLCSIIILDFIPKNETTYHESETFINNDSNIRILIFGSFDTHVQVLKFEELLNRIGYDAIVGAYVRPGFDFYKNNIEFIGNEKYFLRNVITYRAQFIDSTTVEKIINVLKNEFGITFDQVIKNENLPTDRDIEIIYDRAISF